MERISHSENKMNEIEYATCHECFKSYQTNDYNRLKCDYCLSKSIPETKKLNHDCFFAPPWNMNEFPEKTLGWIAFQQALNEDPEYYLEEYGKRK